MDEAMGSRSISSNHRIRPMTADWPAFWPSAATTVRPSSKVLDSVDLKAVSLRPAWGITNGHVQSVGAVTLYPRRVRRVRVDLGRRTPLYPLRPQRLNYQPSFVKPSIYLPQNVFLSADDNTNQDDYDYALQVSSMYPHSG